MSSRHLSDPVPPAVTDVTFVLPGLMSNGGVRAVFEIADRLRDKGRTTAILIPRRSILSPGRSFVGMLERLVPKAALPLVQRIASKKPLEQTWFPLQTPIVAAGSPLLRDIPSSRVIVATSWRTAEEVLRSPDARDRGVYLIQHYEDWSGPKRRIDATWEAFDRIVVTARWLSELATERFHKTQPGLAVYGVDLETFFPDTAPEHRAVPVIGFMHDDREWKGGEDLLRALSSVRQDHDVSIRAFGNGTKPLPTWIRSAGRLSGHDLAGFYRSLDVFVSASWFETGPMTVPEAMACGVPIVTTDVGNVRVWCGEGGDACAKIVPPRDPSALAAGVIALLADRAAARGMGERGRAAIQPFTWGKMADAFEDSLIGFGLLEEVER